jgi:ATP-binding cassette subfamily A (ABC1) protein 5
MVNGRLQCVGTNQHLKVKYGEGYILEIRYSSGHLKDIREFVSQNFTDAQETDNVPGRVSYTMPGGKGVIGRVFGELERCKKNLGIEDYAFNQPTLEGVFISFAKQQQETD